MVDPEHGHSFDVLTTLMVFYKFSRGQYGLTYGNNNMMFEELLSTDVKIYKVCLLCRVYKCLLGMHAKAQHYILWSLPLVIKFRKMLQRS